MSRPVVLSRLAEWVNNEGLIGTARRVCYHCYEYYREWALGIETKSRLDPYGPRGDQQRVAYEPLCYACIDTSLRRLSPHRNDVFLDYGSGRGRVTAVAATYPFRRVIGVELQPELCAAARVNMHRVRGKRCQDWEIIEADATEFFVPDDVNVVFLFNPFIGEILGRVVDRLKASLILHPRRLALIYMNSKSEPDVFGECSWLTLKAELPVGLWQRMRFRHYESVIYGPQEPKGVATCTG